MTESSTAPSPRTVAGLAAAYAAFPALGAALWFALGDPDPLRNRAPVDLLLLVQLAVIVVALGAGYRFAGLGQSMTRVETAALAVFGAVFLGTAALVAVEPVAAMERGAMRLIPVAMALCLAFLIARAGPWSGRAFAMALAAQPLVHLPMLIVLLALYAEDPGHNWLGGPVGFWHVRAWGMIVAAGLAAAFGLYASARPTLASHLVWGLILTVLAALLFFSGTRSGVVGVAAGVGVGAALTGLRVARRLPLFLGAVVAGALLSLLPEPPIEDWGIMNSWGETVSADADTRTGSRLGLWSESLDLIAARPVFGYGHDQFRYHYSEGPDALTHPHGVIFQVLVDFGLVGSLALGVLLFSLWWRGVRAARLELGSGRLGAFLALNTILAMSLVDGALYNTETLAVAAIAWAVLLGGYPNRPAPG